MNLSDNICQFCDPTKGIPNTGERLKYDHIDPNSESVVVCREHFALAGFCISCECFYGGVESFEFENRGICDECLDIWRLD